MIDEYWKGIFSGDEFFRSESLSITSNDQIGTKRPAMIMVTNRAPTQAVIHPNLVGRLGSRHRADHSIAALARDLDDAGVTLHDPDYLYYLPRRAKFATHVPTQHVRELLVSDRPAFDLFESAASDQDREDAAVELEHWTVAGWFEGDRLASVASMVLWDDSPVADIGVLTLPHARGRGCARSVVNLVNSVALKRGFEPQYRCQIDNHASVRLARSCGFQVFGEWIVAHDMNPSSGD